MPQLCILLQLLLQPLVDEDLVVDSIEEAVVAVVGATSMLPRFLRPSNGYARRMATQEVPVVAEWRTMVVVTGMLHRAERCD